MSRLLRAAAFACLLTMLVGASALGSSSGAQRPSPPSRAELRQATESFLQRHGAKAAPAAKGAAALGPAPTNGLFPRNRVVSLYGAPQLPATILGRKKPARAVEKLKRQSRPYRRRGDEPVIKAFDLIATIATPCEGGRDKCRMRQPGSLIATYMKHVRGFGGRLILDIQPGRSSVLDEIRHFREWVLRPNVDIAIDPEWNVKRDESPGEDAGSITARELNRVSGKLQRMTDEHGLPPKLMIVHQFRRGSIRHRGQVRQRRDVDVTLNFDGIGSRQAKRSGYQALAVEGLFNGFSLFYLLDDGLMTPRQVLATEPEPSYVMYQ